MARNTIEVRLIASGAAGAQRDLAGVGSSAQRMGREIDRAAQQSTTGLDKVNARLDATRNYSQRAAQGLTQTGRSMTLFASLPLAAALFKSEQAAAHLNEVVDYSSRVFGTASDEMTRFGDTALDRLGLSRLSALEAANGFGTLVGELRELGLSDEDVAGLSQRLVKLAVDTTSAVDPAGGLQQALQGVHSALVGEYDPAQRLGLILTANTVKQYAYANGIARTGQELTEQQKILASVGLLFQQGAKYQDNYSQTADSAANSQRRAGQAAAQAGADLGQKLIPFAKAGSNALEVLAEGFEHLPAAAQAGVAGVAILGTLAGPLVSVVGLLAQLRAARIANATIAAINARAEQADAAATLQNAAAKQAAAVSTGQLTLALEGEATAATAASAASGRSIASIAGRAGAGLAIVTSLFLAVKQLRDAAEEDVTLDVQRAAGSTTGQLVNEFSARGPLAKFRQEREEAFRLLAEGSPATAQRAVAGLKQAGEDTSAYERILRQVAAAHRRATADTDKNTEATKDFSSNINDLVGNLGGATSALDAAAAGAKDWGEALDIGINRTLDAASASRGYENELRRLEELTDPAKAEADHARAVDDAARAQRDAAQATRDRQDAEERLHTAEAKSLATERERAAIERDRAQLSKEEAQQGRADAQAELDRITGDTASTPEQITKARFALREATQRVAEATQQATDADNEYQDIASGARLEREKAEARDAVADATDRERDALRKRTEAERAATPKTEDLAQKQRDLADQMDRVVRAAEADIGAKIAAGLIAPADATQNLIDRLRFLAQVFPQLADTINNYLASLSSPHEQEFHIGSGTFRARGGIDAFVATRPMVRFAEPSTGGEAYIPRLGIDSTRGRMLADVAARWHGGRVVPMASGGVMAMGGVQVVAIPESRVGVAVENLIVPAADPREFERWAARKQRQRRLVTSGS